MTDARQTRGVSSEGNSRAAASARTTPRVKTGACDCGATVVQTAVVVTGSGREISCCAVCRAWTVVQ